MSSRISPRRSAPGLASVPRASSPAVSHQSTSEEPSSLPAVYIKRSISATEVIAYDSKTVVICGNVAKGAKVIAGGDVVVLGRCDTVVKLTTSVCHCACLVPVPACPC